MFEGISGKALSRISIDVARLQADCASWSEATVIIEFAGT
jgi:hypothetical protein